MAGRSIKNGRNFSPFTKFETSGKDKDFHTAENTGTGALATGGQILDPGDGYIYHVFTSDGTFTPNAPAGSMPNVDFMLVGGGGSGGAGSYSTPSPGCGGGGGGGGFVKGNVNVSPGQNYPISIGAGGGTVAPPPNYYQPGELGSPTTAFGRTAIGGGGGRNRTPNATYAPYESSNVDSGGSGGGASFLWPYTSPSYVGGKASFNSPQEPSEKMWQGHDGGEYRRYSPWIGSPNDVSPIGGRRWSAAGGGAGGAAYIYPIPTITSDYAPDGRLNVDVARGPGRLVPSFPIPSISPAFPATTITDLSNPLINGFGSGGHGSNVNPGVDQSPSFFQLGNNANTGAGGLGYHGNHTSNHHGNSGVVIIRYKKFHPGTNQTRATGGDVVEPGTNVNHLGKVRHIFTSPGTFTVNDPSLVSVRYLAVGGGGGGAGGWARPSPFQTWIGGGGGGAGGFVTSETTGSLTPSYEKHSWSNSPARIGSEFEVSSTETGGYAIVIGQGGAGGVGAPNFSPPNFGSGFKGTPGTNGGNTTIGTGPNQIVAWGGGGGANAFADFPSLGPPEPATSFYKVGEPGGSGGGGAAWYGTGNKPLAHGGNAADPAIPGTENRSQGNPGFRATNTPTSYATAGGGGGAGPLPPNTPYDSNEPGGDGGWGMWSDLAPPSYGTPGPETGKRYFAGGGAGSAYFYRGISAPPANTPHPTSTALLNSIGGYGGGGNSNHSPYPGSPFTYPGTWPSSVNGSANTGGGGGGTMSYTSSPIAPGGSGGSGIVIIEYPE